MAQFLGLDKTFSSRRNSRFVIIPVPYDHGCSWQKGTAKGPKAILEASNYLELYDLPTRTEPYHQGIHVAKEITRTTDPGIVRAVGSAVKSVLKEGKIPIVLGGNHTVSIGAAKAASPVTVVQLDAHADYNDSFKGSPFNHACVMARAAEHAEIIQIGVRSVSKEEMDRIDLGRVFFADDIRCDPLWMQEAIRLIPGNVYLTIDLDVFDPSIMPSTGTPEPGGMFWEEVMEFIHFLAISRTIVGFDVVELMPTANKAPDYLAAKLIYRTIAEIASHDSAKDR